MALETVVFQQDPFSYGYKDFYSMGGYGYSYGLAFEEERVIINSETLQENKEQGAKEWETHSSSLEVCTAGDGLLTGTGDYNTIGAPVCATAGRRKRRRTKSFKNKEEMENQRMTHIAVERNRRKQMNDYLAVLRSMMPPSYAQRGDQASVVGGAINFVKELEQLLQFLEAHKQIKEAPYSPIFANFFSFPQYSTHRPIDHDHNNLAAGSGHKAAKKSTIADIEVTMVETHANIKVLWRRQPKQLLKLVSGFYSLGLTVLHLNVTTADHTVLYSFSVKVEEDCQLSTVNDLATSVHKMMDKIQEEVLSS